MATIKSFKAWRPSPGFVSEISSVPYDVVSTKEARELALNKPHNFLHVIRPEIDLPDTTDIHDQIVYEKGRENLLSLLNSDTFFQEQENNFYVYRLVWNGKSMTGIFCCVSVEDYDNGVILKHELTRPDKETDRTKHIFTQQAHAEPVMLTFEEPSELLELIQPATENEPLYSFSIDNETEHTVWKVTNPSEFETYFQNIPKLYIADGHHRCASASRVAEEMKANNPAHSGKEEYNFFPAVLFPKTEMNILAYNRIIYSLPEGFFERLNSSFKLSKSANPSPANKGIVAFYFDNAWHEFELPQSQKNDPAASLDIARLQEFIFEPFLNITNQRTDENVYFVGGIRGSKELERIVDSGEAELAISLYPTSIEELIAISDAELLMPPKSTWFEPKLRSGLLVHTF